MRHVSSSVVCTLTSADVMQCMATVMMLAGVVFFGILIGSLGEIVPHAFNIDEPDFGPHKKLCSPYADFIWFDAVCGNSDDAGRRGLLWHPDWIPGRDCAACQHPCQAGPDVQKEV